MSQVINRLKDCVQATLGYPERKIEQSNGTLSYEYYTPKGTKFKLFVEEPYDYYIVLFTFYMPRFPEDHIQKNPEVLSKLLYSFLKRSGNGAYYKLDEEKGFYIEVTFNAKRPLTLEDIDFNCHQLIKAQARIGRLVDYLPEDLSSLGDIPL